MTTEPQPFPHAFLASIQPIVLVGGKSQRFGRDKLREPWGPNRRPLVEFPIIALRTVFGPRVKLVGQCHPSIEHLADGMIPDLHPGTGPLGGILSALTSWQGPVLVLAGDMPCFGVPEISSILTAAQQNQTAQAIWAHTNRPHPCAGLYSQHARPQLEARLSTGSHALVTAFDRTMVRHADVSEAAAANVNRPGDLHPPSIPSP